MVKIELFDANGDLVYPQKKSVEKGSNKFEIDVPSLPQGIYFGRVSTANIQCNFKVMKCI